MKNFERALIGLDLSEMDALILPKVFALSKLLGLKKLYFIHIAKDLAIPEEIKRKFPDLAVPIDETLEKEIQQSLNGLQIPDDIAYEIIVSEGKPMMQVLKCASNKDVDLIIMGRKTRLEGSGSLAKTMAQKAPCSVLFLTEDENIQVPHKVLIPMDFSTHSILTLQFAEKISEELGAAVMGLHIYEVPMGYYKTGKSFDEFAAIMKKHAEGDFQKFLEHSSHSPLECLFELKTNKSRAEMIIEIAQKSGADLIVMGSRGRTGSAAVLLGSVAENLVSINNQLPMLIVKKKGETMGFLDALSRI
jgi:nucleotide-binding universal stress UspA family protein